MICSAVYYLNNHWKIFCEGSVEIIEPYIFVFVLLFRFYSQVEGQEPVVIIIKTMDEEVILNVVYPEVDLTVYVIFAFDYI